MPYKSKPLQASFDEIVELENLVASNETSPWVRLRAKAVLAMIGGESNKSISLRTGTNEDSLGMWRRNFKKDRVKGLYDKPRSGRPKKNKEKQNKSEESHEEVNSKSTLAKNEQKINIIDIDKNFKNADGYSENHNENKDFCVFIENNSCCIIIEDDLSTNDIHGKLIVNKDSNEKK